MSDAERKLEAIRVELDRCATYRTTIPIETVRRILDGAERTRYCYWHDESYQDPDTGEFFVARIEEGKPGYWRVGEMNCRTTGAARQVAEKLNERLGLAESDVRQIRMSSMAAEVVGEHFDGA